MAMSRERWLADSYRAELVRAARRIRSPITRKRAVFHNALSCAVELGLLPANPTSAERRAAGQAGTPDSGTAHAVAFPL